MFEHAQGGQHLVLSLVPQSGHRHQSSLGHHSHPLTLGGNLSRPGERLALSQTLGLRSVHMHSGQLHINLSFRGTIGGTELLIPAVP